jgi:hypothetical protein
MVSSLIPIMATMSLGSHEVVEAVSEGLCPSLRPAVYNSPEGVQAKPKCIVDHSLFHVPQAWSIALADKLSSHDELSDWLYISRQPRLGIDSQKMLHIHPANKTADIYHLVPLSIWTNET